MRVLFLGDVFGRGGCEIVRRHLPSLRKTEGIDFCVVNGENSAPGNGITPDSLRLLYSAGADAVTTGNHAFRRSEIYDTFDADPYLLRPANYSAGCPGRGSCILDRGALRLGVINLMGTAFMEPLANPFDTADAAVASLRDEGIKCILVDFHAEATGEKRALGFYLDGRVSALIGTHTHVQTSDACVLPSGTAYMTDAGMCGAIDSVLGVEPALIIAKMKTGMPVRFAEASGGCKMEGCIIEIDEKTGAAASAAAISVS